MTDIEQETRARAKSPATSAAMFDKTPDADLAYWLVGDAHGLDGRPGMNNHVAATRAAAERLLREPASPATREAVARVLHQRDVDGGKVPEERVPTGVPGQVRWEPVPFDALSVPNRWTDNADALLAAFDIRERSE